MDYREFKEKRMYSEASGSMAVVDDNIVMTLNQYGLFEEQLLDSTKGISKIAEFVSPNFNSTFNESIIATELFGNAENMNFDSRLGFYSELYVGYVSEGNYRKNASSGGMGTWIFKELLEKNMIDYVINVKKNNDLEAEVMFKYEISSNIDDLKKGAKTKYYPVEISEVIKKVKENPGRYAIVGIPSFIYAVRLLMKQDSILENRIKYTIGLICGHQKSSKFAEFMGWQVGFKPGDMKDIDFRYKLDNQPANRYAVKMSGLINGKEMTIIKPTSELYGQNWGWGLFKPTASNFTDDVFNETADIVLGDAWLPRYTSDSKGTNVVIVRNQEIGNLINKAIAEERLVMDKVDNKTIFASQSSHYQHTHDELSYRLYKKESENEWTPIKRVKASSKISNFRKNIQDLRSIISNNSHKVYLEAVQNNDIDYFMREMSVYTEKYTDLYVEKDKLKKLNIFSKHPYVNIIKKLKGIFK